jgi:hypothetical protein
MDKKCSKCNEFKDLSEFYNNSASKDGHRPECIECTKKRRDTTELKIKRKEYQQTDVYKAYRAKYRSKPNVKSREYKRQKDYLARPEVAKRRKKYFQRKDVKENRNAYNKKRQQNPHWKISANTSGAIRKALMIVGETKRKRHWEDIVGYTKEDLKLHLEKQFKEGMSWDNYGKWQIDHIKPISSFKITDVNCEELKKCWALENLQPLWAIDNMRKGNRY